MVWESEAASDADVYEDSGIGDTPRLLGPDSRGPEVAVHVDAQVFDDEIVVPAAVQRILLLRRDEDERNEASAEGRRPLSAAIDRPTCEELTPLLRDFSEEVQHLHSESQVARRATSPIEVQTFFDLQAYNIDAWAQKLRKEPGSILLTYMFYSRIYEKLVGKQKGVDVPLFAPVDFNDRLLGFRAILDWAKDFKVCPARVPRRELERLFVTCHAGSLPSHEKFASKITYHEFVLFLALCGNCGEPMDRSRVDGSRVREVESRLEQVKRLGIFLCLANPKKVKLALHDAYRDVHFWKLSDGADFAKEARAAEMRSRPQYRVDALSISENDPEVVAARRYLEQFTWSHQEHLWEEFEVPCVDMGCFVLQGASKTFKLAITNRGLSLARIKLEASSIGPLRMPWKDQMLGPGQTIDVMIEVAPIECGEWRGHIVVKASWTGLQAGEAEAQVPTYVKVLQPHKGNEALTSRLPWHAPRPFRSGSAKRVFIDMASLNCHQMRAPTPHRHGLGRPYSAASNLPTAPAEFTRRASSAARCPSSRGCQSATSTGVPSSRPLSGLAPSSVRAWSGQVGRPYGTPLNPGGFEHGPLHAREKAFHAAYEQRPHSAPSTATPSAGVPISARLKPAVIPRPHSASALSGAGVRRHSLPPRT